MNDIIPLSGRPADLQLVDLLTVEHCDCALVWLSDVLNEMATQVKDRGDGDPEWLKRIRVAQRNTLTLRHRILRKRDSLARTASLAEAVAQTALDILPTSAVAGFAAELGRRYPHLAGFDIAALREG